MSEWEQDHNREIKTRVQMCVDCGLDPALPSEGCVRCAECQADYLARLAHQMARTPKMHGKIVSAK